MESRSNKEAARDKQKHFEFLAEGTRVNLFFVGNDTSGHQLIKDGSGPIIVYRKEGQSELGTRNTINAELSDSSKLYGLFKEAIKDPKIQDVFCFLLDVELVGNPELSAALITQRFAEAVSAEKVKDVENRLLVISVAGNEDLLKQFGLN